MHWTNLCTSKPREGSAQGMCVGAVSTLVLSYHTCHSHTSTCKSTFLCTSMLVGFTEELLLMEHILKGCQIV